MSWNSGEVLEFRTLLSGTNEAPVIGDIVAAHASLVFSITDNMPGETYTIFADTDGDGSFESSFAGSLVDNWIDFESLIPANSQLDVSYYVQEEYMAPDGSLAYNDTPVQTTTVPGVTLNATPIVTADLFDSDVFLTLDMSNSVTAESIEIVVRRVGETDWTEYGAVSQEDVIVSILDGDGVADYEIATRSSRQGVSVYSASVIVDDVPPLDDGTGTYTETGTTTDGTDTTTGGTDTTTNDTDTTTNDTDTTTNDTDPTTNDTDPTTNDTDPTTNDTDPTTNDTDPTTNGTDPTTNGTDPATNGTDPATNGTDPTTNGTDPTTNGTDPTTNGADPTTNGADPTTNGADPTTNGADPTTNGADPTTNGADPTTNGTDPTTNGADPTTNGADPTTNGADPTTNGTDPTTNGADPTTDGTDATTDA